MKGPYRLLVALRNDEPLLVVGGGPLAERKMATLLGAGCRPHLIAPSLTESLRADHDRGAFDWEAREATREDFQAFRLVLLALPSEKAERVLPWAREARCLVNCASSAAEGDWALLAQFDSGPCRVGVGSGGYDPALAAREKDTIHRFLTDREVKS